MLRALQVALLALLAVLAGQADAVSADDQPVAKFSTTVFGTTLPTEGLRGQVYDLLHGMNYLPYFTTMQPLTTLYTKSLNIPRQNFSQGFPGLPNLTEWFAIDYQGTIWISTFGEYRFQLTSDDGSKLYIDGVQVIDNDGVHTERTREGAVHLKQGSHRIRISYFQGPRYELALVFSVARPNETAWQIFNTDDFKKPNTAKGGRQSEIGKPEK